MNPLWGFAPLLHLLSWMILGGFVCCGKPSVVNLGAVFTHSSVIGRVAKTAMEMAVSDVNADPGILNGTDLKLIMEDADSNVFMGTIETFQVIGQEVVAIIGPQSSVLAHMISAIANNLQVPVVSYAATDPALSALQFPFFIRTVQSDSYQMAAMADLIAFYGWREVIAIYVDDDFGRNGIYALADEFERNTMKISYRLPLPIQIDMRSIREMLNNSKKFGPRVYVVHVNPDTALNIFTIANEIDMMTSGYVWLATDWLSAALDSLSPVNQSFLHTLQGTVTLRQHTPESKQKRDFLVRWRDMQQNGLVASAVNSYGLCAYDSVWAVARAVDQYISEGRNITFSVSDSLGSHINSTKIQLGKLKVFNGGTALLRKLLEINFTGLTGRVQFNPERNIVSGGYDVINIDQKETRVVGFWSSASGLSVSPPKNLYGDPDRYSRPDQKLGSVTWPGGQRKRPRGWIIADNERPLRIGVPNRFSFKEFVSMEGNTTHELQGYCIDVFNEARALIPYDVPCVFEPYGDGNSNPSYDELINMVVNDVFDAAVGDIAIVTNRTKIVDFCQPYASTGLVIVAPINNRKASAWVFLKPFTAEMWCATAASFVMIAVIMWVLEHRVNKDFRGPPSRQLATMFLFSFSTLFKKNQEDTVSALGRMVMVMWLFLLMVITSSYTASLTSILTVQQLSSPITGIDSLIASEWPIGYQVGSFAYSYLANNLFISPSRLVSLGSPEEYERALSLGPSNGGVAAIVDELPYVELFLSKRTQFGIIGQAFTRGGWGFAFQRGSPLAVDMSTAILKLSEKGRLQTINEKWFCKMGCPDERRKSSKPNHLQLISFWGLYLLCGGVGITSLSFFLFRMIRLYIRHKRQQMSSSISSGNRCYEAVFHFFDFVDQKEDDTVRTTTRTENDQNLPNS